MSHQQFSLALPPWQNGTTEVAFLVYQYPLLLKYILRELQCAELSSELSIPQDTQIKSIILGKYEQCFPSTLIIYASGWNRREMGWVNDFSGSFKVGYIIYSSYKGCVLILSIRTFGFPNGCDCIRNCPPFFSVLSCSYGFSHSQSYPLIYCIGQSGFLPPS